MLTYKLFNNKTILSIKPGVKNKARIERKKRVKTPYKRKEDKSLQKIFRALLIASLKNRIVTH